MTAPAVPIGAGTFEPIDLQLAALVRRRAPAILDTADAELVALTAALLSAERARGHSCLDLETACAQRDGAPRPASAGAWQAALARSGLCGDGAAPTPLVHEGGRVYLYRFWAAERRLAANLRRLLDEPPAGASAPATRALFARLFPTAAETDWQAVAAAGALRHRLSVITGGPGTGKTTTVARILALLLEGEPGLRIALAAPTGKAAARLTESVRAVVATLPLGDALAGRIPSAGRTLHRLLGYQPYDDRFRHRPDHQLVEDVIVVDEASMVDLLLMDALFAAVRPGARVILLGDHDQLASVDTGYVLGDLCAAATASGEGYGAGFARACAAVGVPALPTRAAATRVRDCVVRLQRSWRFEARPGIGALADAIRMGDGARAVAVLEDSAYPEVQRGAHPASVDALLAPMVAALEAYLAAATPDEALARLADFRLLCAVREGTWGVEGVNRAVEQWLRRRGHAVRDAWYHRRPVLVTANDHGAGLFNGDVGVCFRDGGTTLVHFPDGVGGSRAVPPARLPARETAWAMSVHKAQGSEFGRVLLVLPDHESRVLGRELLYTGVTRARDAVTVVGTAHAIVQATERATVRATGLAARLTS